MMENSFFITVDWPTIVGRLEGFSGSLSWQSDGDICLIDELAEDQASMVVGVGVVAGGISFVNS
jgi:hypothetical protein